MMKFLRNRQVAEVADPSSLRADRRGLVVGAGVAGVAALAAAALHRQAVPTAEAAGPADAAPAKDGYQVTPHVLRYYQTTRT